MKKIGVIGAGLGGLSAAIRLAVKGFKVTVFEQNSGPGGKAASVEQDGFRFDAGPSLLTMPFVLDDLFNFAGEKMEDQLKLIKPELICKYFYPDGTIISAFNDVDKFAEEIESKTSDSKKSVIYYLKYCENIYNRTADLFLFNNPSNPKTFISKEALSTLLHLNQIDPFKTMHEANTEFFKDDKTKQLFDRYATYNGSDPYKAPATLNIIPHVEYNIGGFFPQGGIIEITNALFKLAEDQGVNFNFNSSVNKIIVSGNSVKGVTVKGNEYLFDSVISNVDVNTTYKHLLDDKPLPLIQRMGKQEPSLSGLVFYWAVDDLHPKLDMHNILFSKDYKLEFDSIFFNKTIAEDPTIYIYISSKINKADAPDGKENWFVMVNAPYIHNQNWDHEISLARDRILDKIELITGIKLRSKIISEKILSPEDLESKTGSYKGSIYGISSNNKSSAFLRHPNKSKIKNLYFTGGSVHPGGGIPLVVLSGKFAAENIIKEKL